MVHEFYFGLMLLIATDVIVWMYLFFPVIVIIVFKLLYNIFKFCQKNTKNREKYLKYNNILDVKYIKFSIILFVCVFILNLSIYTKERYFWINENHSNLRAKEYYVVGQVVYFYRYSISKILSHPDRYGIMTPLNNLQKIIFNFGSRRLPATDAEKAAWAERWFIYIYSKNLLVKDGTYKIKNNIERYKFITEDNDIITSKIARADNFHILPRENEYFDLVWNCLESLATKKFADKKMRELSYLRNFAGLAHYYSYRAPEAYTKIPIGSRRFYVQMRSMTKRNEMLVNWMNNLKDDWAKDNEFKYFIQKNPRLDAMLQLSMIMTLMDIIDSRIHFNEFSCSDPFLHQLEKSRNEFINGENGNSASYLKMTDKNTADLFKEVIVNSIFSRFISLVLEKKCGIHLSGEEKMTKFNNLPISSEDAREQEIRSLFKKELELLELDEVIDKQYKIINN